MIVSHLRQIKHTHCALDPMEIIHALDNIVGIIFIIYCAKNTHNTEMTLAVAYTQRMRLIR